MPLIVCGEGEGCYKHRVRVLPTEQRVTYRSMRVHATRDKTHAQRAVIHSQARRLEIQPSHLSEVIED